MDGNHRTTDAIRDFVQRVAGDGARDAPIELQPLRGGLEAQEIALATVRHRDAAGRPRLIRFVVKRLQGRATREALVYERLVSVHAGQVSPRLLAVDWPSEDRAILYLEAIRRAGAWMWRDLSIAGELLRQLAGFHRAATGSTALVPDWDYEAEQERMAMATHAALDACRQHPDLAALARSLPAVRRIVLARGRLRGQLLQERPFHARPIHGDVHPGNVLVRRRDGANRPVLLDWARARSGSPLEDVSSWLHSLGFWEDEVRRRHDTLLAGYLAECGMEGKPTAHLRSACWLAGASNALSGALLQHLQAASDEHRSPAQRARSAHAAQAWLRVIRRADACWG
jgi:hypothetical protein